MQNSNDVYRYELKYVLEPESADVLSEVLYAHPAGFVRLFPDRKVNNIYFDNSALSGINSNLFGVSERVKYRYRWYGSPLDFSQGVLEKKIKKNTLGCKRYFKMDNPKTIKELQQQLNTAITELCLEARLNNSYKRSYFIDRSGNFRLTIDREQKYGLVLPDEQPGMHSLIDDPRIIVELKFDLSHEREFDLISQGLPFRLVKHSKYISGMMALLY